LGTPLNLKPADSQIPADACSALSNTYCMFVYLYLSGKTVKLMVPHWE